MTAAHAADQGAPSGATPLGSCLLEGRWEIDTGARLPEFDRRSAQAFAARDRVNPERPVLALGGTGELPFRANAANLLKHAKIPGLLELLAFGAVPWPSPDRTRLVFIYVRPEGDAIASAFAHGIAQGREMAVLRTAIRPLLDALRGLERLDITHRGIRPDNIWFAGKDGQRPVLGCGLAGPAGIDQPLAFEPIERALASPAGRGEGRPADDVFALGVTMLALVTGCDPAGERTDDQLLAARIEKGSFAALADQHRLPSPLLDALRAMLVDDAPARWKVPDVESWLEGGRPVARPCRLPTIPGAPFQLAEEQHVSLRGLARAILRHPVPAARTVQSGDLETWLRLAMHDPAKAKRLANAKTQGCPSDDLLLARAAMILDPGGPIRYQDLAFAPDGFGPELVRTVLTGRPLGAAADILLFRLPQQRTAARPLDQPPDPEPAPGFAALAAWLQDAHPGQGPERCLYEANPGLHCLSPPLRARFVFDLGRLLPALEEAAGSPHAGPCPVDRHVAAFIAARSTDDLSRFLRLLAKSDPAEQVMGQVGLLASVLAHHPAPPLPRLAAWIRPVVAAYHNRGTRAAVEADLRKAVASGDLARLNAIINDHKRRREDQQGFAAARADYARCEAEVGLLSIREPSRRRAARIAGLRAAPFVAWIAASASAGLAFLSATH